MYADYSNAPAVRPLDGYVTTDQDIANEDLVYYGSVDKNGAWTIQQEITSLGTFRWASGRSGYAVAWSNRASLVYGKYNEVLV